MIRLEINPACAGLLAANGLVTFDDIMKTGAGTPIEENDERDTRRLRLEDGVYYLKRVWREKASVAIESYLSGRRAHGRPYREMQQYRCLREHGFEVAEIAAVGEKTRFGFPQQGFILTREVPGRDLLQVYRDSDEDQRLAVARRFGDLVGRLYRHGFYGSIRLKDVICCGPPGKSASLTLIDREVRHPFPRKPGADLGMSKLRLNFRRQVQQGEIFSPRELEVFVEHFRRSLPKSLRNRREDISRELGLILQKAGHGAID